MIKLFKDLMALYFIGISIIVVLDIFLLELSYNSGAIIFISLILYIFLFITLYNTAKKRFSKIGEYMNNCQIKKFIQEMSKLSKSNKTINNIIAVSLSSAYISIGDKEKAFEMISRVSFQVSNKPAVLLNQAVVYNNLFVIYLRNGEIDKAEDALNIMKRCIDNPAIKEPNDSMISNRYISKKFSLNMEKGNYNGALEYFLIVLDTEKTLLGKVQISYTIAKIFLHNDDFDSAKKYLHFVAENGGDTEVCNLAKEKLKSLGI